MKKFSLGLKWKKKTKSNFFCFVDFKFCLRFTSYYQIFWIFYNLEQTNQILSLSFQGLRSKLRKKFEDFLYLPNWANDVFVYQSRY